MNYDEEWNVTINTTNQYGLETKRKFKALKWTLQVESCYFETNY